MFDPLTISLAIAALAVASVVTYLTVTVIRNYLRERRTNQNVNAKPALMVDRLNNGDYSVVTGFFDGNTKVLDSKVWNAQKLDEDLQKFPISKPVIIES
ncbi:hypothetical protein [Brasilonema bromeliae]|uniref:Uncharacterized protein n=1 Tax=Brasilonema bromeliae SPC951 TaxID=385972 RepID=A0ABX1P2F5_9CYAN|nr:hypothetical protein [Brasilonema bromeliae]NMG17941.1 hypothetical protein [Brasilonema bromeliae SPC951]